MTTEIEQFRQPNTIYLQSMRQITDYFHGQYVTTKTFISHKRIDTTSWTDEDWKEVQECDSTEYPYIVLEINEKHNKH